VNIDVNDFAGEGRAHEERIKVGAIRIIPRKILQSFENTLQPVHLQELEQFRYYH
jgi:hypothetical protein